MREDTLSSAGGRRDPRFWQSVLLYPGQSFSYTFTSGGTFQYHCQEHPSGMIGTVIMT